MSSVHCISAMYNPVGISIRLVIPALALKSFRIPSHANEALHRSATTVPIFSNWTSEIIKTESTVLGCGRDKIRQTKLHNIEMPAPMYTKRN